MVIARLLNSEGFTDYVANQIERYWKNSSGLTDRQKQKIRRLEKALSDFMRDKTEGEKAVIGKFIGLHKKMSFDTGLRMGLSAFAARNAEDVPDETTFLSDAT